MITTGTRVRLHGKLAQELGREEWEFLIERPREAVAALEANTGKLNAFLKRESTTEYRLLINGKDMAPWDPSELPAELWASGDYETIDIIPVPAGASGGIWQAIIGVVLIVVGVVLILTGYGSAVAPYVITAGIGLLLGGVAAMLAPSPKLGGGIGGRAFMGTSQALQQKEEDSHNEPSYLFSGAANTSQQGGPVPLLYGEHIVGSQLISMGIHAGTVAGIVLGGARPPGPDDPFFDLPGWALLQADPRAALVPTDRSVRQASNPLVRTHTAAFGIPETYPMSWPDKSLRGHAISNKAHRGFLYTLSRLFNFHLRAISLHDIKRLYRVLEVNTIPDPSGTPVGRGLREAGWEIVMAHVADYYLTH